MAATEKHLHIIAFDIPIPTNYGGAIDIFYKLKALQQQGIKIHLHCFQYGRPQSDELLKYCSSIHYYPRRMGMGQMISSSPFIVASRRSEHLLEVLLSDHHPILFEGLHTTSHLDDRRLGGRRKVVRTHNIEHHYYAGLAEAESSLLRKAYFRFEASRLRAWESKLRSANAIAAISLNDESHFRKINPSVRTISAFHPDDKVTSSPGFGTFALYHGSLDVSENQRAALWLIEKIFPSLRVPLVIAGNKAPDFLRRAAESSPSVTLMEGLSAEEIRDLVAEAQVNVLPTFQATGVKLKLLAALHRGRHCLVNEPMVINTGLEPLCQIANDADSFRKRLKRLMETPFGEEELNRRKQLLEGGIFSNRHNADRLISLIYDGEDFS